jgi:hypothetical protein
MLDQTETGKISSVEVIEMEKMNTEIKTED